MITGHQRPRARGSRLAAGLLSVLANCNPLVKKLRQLFPLTEHEEAILENACRRVVKFLADEDIVREGDYPANCNVLLEGMVARHKHLADGRRQILSFHIPGDIYDTQSFLLNESDHSISTLTPCTVAVISHRAMLNITDAHPGLARALWKDTLVDAAIFREWIANIGSREGYARLAHLMCEMFVRFQSVGLAPNNTIDWPMTQAELGDAQGMSNVHVNRIIQELRRAGLITQKSGTLVVHDWNALKTASGFDARYLHLSDTTRANFPH